MLNNLYIKNFALFDELSVDFDDGLNIISGETGSGKSILINAIGLLTASRINKNFIGNFAKETIVEASFSMSNSLSIILDNLGIESDDNIVISRRFSQSSSSIKVNNRPINLSALETLSQALIDIHGQHSQLVALNKSNYIKIIDSFDESTKDLKEEIKFNINENKRLEEKLKEIELDDEQILREIDILQFQIEEIESFDFDNFNEEELSKEHKKLTNLTEILAGTHYINSLFNEGYQRRSLKDYVNDLYSKLLDLSEFDQTFEEFTSRAIDLRENVRELANDIESYSYSINLDENRLKNIENIFSKIHSLKRKYGPEIVDIQAFYKKSLDRLDELKNIEKIKEDINSQIEQISKNNLNLAKSLSEKRKSIIKVLEKAMIEELSQMNMKNLEFSIDLTQKEEIGDNGFDQVDFLISTNKGQEKRSLNTVASGGEISRFMLALKAVLADSEEVQTIVFDEIDTGISGKTADIVGDKLVNISKKRQLIVITHLPQIAAKADHHYLIEKNSTSEITKSSLTKLDEKMKVKEVARLISGLNITESTMSSAQELIENAKR